MNYKRACRKYKQDALSPKEFVDVLTYSPSPDEFAFFFDNL
jgi:hypothetical protein